MHASEAMVHVVRTVTGGVGFVGRIRRKGPRLWGAVLVVVVPWVPVGLGIRFDPRHPDGRTGTVLFVQLA